MKHAPLSAARTDARILSYDETTMNGPAEVGPNYRLDHNGQEMALDPDTFVHIGVGLTAVAATLTIVGGLAGWILRGWVGT